MITRTYTLFILLLLSLCCFACADLTEDEVALNETVKIINGNLENNAPQAVRIMVNQSTNCTGTLIAPTLVLTAAHCVESPNGYITNTHVDIVQNGQVIERLPVVDQLMHSGWNITDAAINHGYDVALIYLAQASRVSPMPIDMTPPNQHVGQLGTAVGFGRYVAQSSDSTGVKLSVIFRINRMIGSGPIFELVSPDQVLRSSCSGDSGGPLLMPRGIAGVASWVSRSQEGVLCLGGQSYYTSVYQHINWINQNLQGPRVGRRRVNEAPLEQGGGYATNQPSQPSQPGQPSQPQLGIGSASCGETVQCQLNCPTGEQSCLLSCLQRSSSVALDQINSLQACIQQTQCSDWSCVETYCPSQYMGCFGNTYSSTSNVDAAQTNNDSTSSASPQSSTGNGCLTLSSCLNTCSNNQNCIQSCANQATSQAIGLYNEVLNCGQYYCAGSADPQNCVLSYCSYEISACQDDY